MTNNDIFESVKDEIIKMDIAEDAKKILLDKMANMQKTKINILVTGSTGCGKSSTINALFNADKANIGTGSDPETMKIDRYTLNNLVIWDSPGLGDGKDADNKHSKKIIDKLNEKDDNGNALIDVVLVILDGGSKDLGTSYELINQVIIPNLGKNTDRILVAINQADMAMKGRYWDFEKNEPQEPLIKHLNEKVQSVKRRIKEGTGVDIEPIYYSAGYKEEGLPQCKPYNLSKLLYFIMRHTPEEKRAVYANNVSQNKEMWQNNDTLANYNREIGQGFGNSIGNALTGAAAGAAAGAKIGSFIPIIGPVVGSIVGGIAGFLGGLFDW